MPIASKVRAPSTGGGDTIKFLSANNLGFEQASGVLTITSADGTSLSSSNILSVTLPGSTNGQTETLEQTSDITIDIQGYHAGVGTKGDITSALLRVYAINDSGTLKFGVGYQGGLREIKTSHSGTTATGLTDPEDVLVNSTLTGTSPAIEVGYLVCDFDDTGNGSGEDFWDITSMHPGESADGIWQPFNTIFAGFSSDPTVTESKFTQVGRLIHAVCLQTGGTSNTTTFTMTGPVKSQVAELNLAGLVTDNGATSPTEEGRVDTASGSTTWTLFKSIIASPWTASGAKRADAVKLIYEAFIP